MHLIGCAVLFKITSPVKCTHTCTPRRLRLPRRAMVIYQNNCGVKCELEAHKKLLVLPVVSVSVRAAEWLMVLNVCNSVQADAGNYWSTCELAGWTMPSTFISASHQRISKDRVRMNEIINSLICKLTVNRFCKSHLLGPKLPETLPNPPVHVNSIYALHKQTTTGTSISHSHLVGPQSN